MTRQPARILARKACRIGGRWYEEGESTRATSRVNDALYRLVIKARIIKTTIAADMPGFWTDCAWCLATQPPMAPACMTVQDLGNMAMRINIGRPLSAVERRWCAGWTLSPARRRADRRIWRLTPKKAGWALKIKSNMAQ